MKTYNAIISVMISLLSISYSLAQSYDQNFEINYLITQSNVDNIDEITDNNSLTQIKYVDGLNRPVQIINKKFSPNSRDLIQPVRYDEYGRQDTTYLAFTLSGNDGDFVADYRNEVGDFYHSSLKVAHTDYPYAVSEYDDSPYNKVLKQGNAGYTWQLDKHPVSSSFSTNDASDNVKILTWMEDTTCCNISGQSYPSNSLAINIVTDENGNSAKRYTDKLGRVVMTERIGDNSTKIRTYYVYDPWGNLAYAVSPEGSDVIDDWATTTYFSESFIEDWVYGYKYDEKHRLIEKRIPGREYFCYVYDNLDRILLTQDGNMRENNDWLFTKYDVKSRPVIVGRYMPTTVRSRSLMQQYIDTIIDNSTYYNHEKFVTPDTSYVHGYTDQAFPPEDDCELYKVYYYDSYDFDTDSSYTFRQHTNYSSNNSKVFYRNKGSLTGRKIRVFDPEASADEWIYEAYYYDKYGNVLQVQKENRLDSIDVVHNKYDFTGKLMFSTTEQISNINQTTKTISIEYENRYDHAGRVSTQHYKVDNMEQFEMAGYKYNELGQLIEKNIHYNATTRNYLQSIDYQYNIRGWLTRINQSNLLNDNYFIGIDSIDADKKVTGLVIDTLNFVVTEIDVRNGENYFLEEIWDNKYLILAEIDDPDDTTHLDADENFDDQLMESSMDSLTYDALKDINNQLISFDFDSLCFDQDDDILFIRDTINLLVKDQLEDENITDTLITNKVVELIDEYIMARVGIVYFNEDSDDLFGMDLCYQEGFNALEGDAQYNGNISAIKWQVDGNNEGIRGYGFEYDKLDRLKGALFGLQSGSSWSRTSEDFTVTGITYDDNGNIKTLQRYGVDSLGGSTYGYGLMDDLHYVYGDDGNVLTVVEDSIADFTFTNNDFSDGSSTALNEYRYDKNGNLTSDANKGITSITYNWLDLPTLVSFSSGGSISFMYDADGTLLEKTISSTGYSEEIKYCGNFVYTDDTLAYIMTTEGIAKYIDDTTYRYEYFLKDHLGSVRAVFTDSDNDGTAELIGEDHYYPFGLTMGGLSYVDGSSEENKYKYNGKELQDNFGLEWYNYGFRMQDPQVGRWFSIDPLSEESYMLSPYAYGVDNPIRFIDAYGLSAEAYITNNETEISNFLNFLVNGGSLDSYDFSNGSWSETGTDNNNPGDIIIIGDEDFIKRIEQALYTIDFTLMGSIVLDIIYYYGIIWPLTVEQTMFESLYNPNTSTILYSGYNPVYGLFGVDKSDIVNLGHELFHACQHRQLGMEYVNLAKTELGKNILERGAMGFENYLLSVVFGSDNFRLRYGLEKLWNNVTTKTFNYYNERIYPVYPTDINGNEVYKFGPIYYYNTLGHRLDNIMDFYQNLLERWIKP